MMHHRKGTECCPSLASDSGDICRKLDTLLLRKFIGSSYLFPSSKHSFASAMGYYGSWKFPEHFFFKSEPPLFVFHPQDWVMPWGWQLRAEWTFPCSLPDSDALQLAHLDLVQLSPFVVRSPSDVSQIKLLMKFLCQHFSFTCVSIIF